MERYFFHIDFGEQSHDEEGTLLPHLGAARDAAVQLLGRLLIDDGDSFWDKPEATVIVTDAEGLVLWSIKTVGFASAAVQERHKA